MGKIELLAPAGDFDSLRAAVENGADAIYLGGRLFNARQSASNFGADELKAALEYSHMRDVKIYLTLNILVSDDELQEALDFAREAYIAGIDGVIVQDIGLAGALHKVLPGLPLHGSTQMTIYDADGAKQLENMGFRRVVLAREVPVEEIAEIVRQTSLEVEIFAHGALCVCYSGQCLMSSIIGGRSGNRGRCAQPCRLPYELIEQDGADNKGGFGNKDGNGKELSGYLLSPKDLCLVDSLSEIIGAGVSSLKLEGRMKGPEYVAAVVGTYRKYLDRLEQSGSSKQNLKIDETDMHDLMQVFNRGGFSEGYFHGKTGRDMMCYEKPKNWGTYLGKTVSYNAAAETVRIRLEQGLSMGDGIEIWNGENVSPGTVVSYLRKCSADKAGKGAAVRSVPTQKADAGDVIDVGYVRGRIGKDQSVYKTSDKGLNARLNESWSGKPNKKVPIYGKVTVTADSPIILEVWDGKGNKTLTTGTVLPQQALNKALTPERLKEQLNKTGGTPFEFYDLEILVKEGLAIPVSEINEVRRQALAELETKRSAAFGSRNEVAGTVNEFKTLTGRFFNEIKAANEVKEIKNTGEVGVLRPANHFNKAPGFISIYFYKWDSSKKYSSYEADRIYLPYSCLFDNKGEAVVKTCKLAGQEVYIQLPVITRGNTQDLIYKAVEKANSWEMDGFLAGNPGTVRFLKENTRFRIFGDTGLNIFNSASLREAELIGLEGVTLSAELTLEQINSMAKPSGLGIEAAVYGRLPLMVSEYCPVGSITGGFGKNRKCGGSCSKGDYSLRDRKDVEFPVVCDNISCRSTILNSNVLFIPDLINGLTLGEYGSLRLYIWNEPVEQVNELCRLHKDLKLKGRKALQQYGELISLIKAQGYTKGHYLRGV